MEQHESHLRRTFVVAEHSRSNGNHPFGALLVGPDDKVLIEAENDSRSGDRTAHAERVLLSRASLIYPSDFLARCTLYSSAEPCAMCAGAAYWVGIGRVVYALSENDLRDLIGPNHSANLTMNLPCRQVLCAGQREIQVVGPLLKEESLAIHNNFWS